MRIRYFFPVVFCVLVSASNYAHGTTLKQIQVASENQVDLLFDSKIAKQQVKTEFFNDIIQLSLSSASVYPAKISSVRGETVVKVFAYQYAPKLVRCRFTVKGKAESYKNKVHIVYNGKLLSVRISADSSDKITSHLAQATRLAAGASGDEGRKGNPGQGSKPGLKDEDLLKKITEQDPLDNQPMQGAQQKAVPSLTEGKSLPSPLRSIGKVALVIAIMVGMLLILRRFGGRLNITARLQSRMGLGGGKKGKIIEVVASHYIGPKKSILVVKIAGKTLVLGLSNESINLIAQLPAESASKNEPTDITDEELGLIERAGIGKINGVEVKPTGSGAVAAGAPVFSDMLAGKSGQAAHMAWTSSEVRDRIRNKVGALKPI